MNDILTHCLNWLQQPETVAGMIFWAGTIGKMFLTNKKNSVWDKALDIAISESQKGFTGKVPDE